MQNVQFPTWLAIVLLAAPPVATFLGALIGQWVSSKGASKREEETWKRTRHQHLIDSRTSSYGELLAALRHWLQELHAWNWYLVVDEGFEPAYPENREELEKRAREAVAAVSLMASERVATLAAKAHVEIIKFRDRQDFESAFTELRPVDGTDSSAAVSAVEKLEEALRSDLEGLLGLELG